MGSPRLICGVLFAVLVWTMVQLFVREDGYARMRELQQRVAEQRASNAEAARLNQQLTRAIVALQQPGEAIEERARMDLGMVRPDETFFQVLDVAPPAQTEPAER
jgi:cell division protein FtsB